VSDPEVAFSVTDGYIQLPVDVDPDTLLDDQLDAISTTFPGWEPSEGHLEVVLLESFAAMASETAQVAGQVPIAVFSYFGQLAGILPQAGLPATCLSTWTAIDDAGYTIPAGTVVGFAVTGTDLELFETLTDAVIPPGATSLDGVVLSALQVGVVDSGIPAGPVTPVDSLAFVESIVSTSVSSGGVDPETQDVYLNRLSAELQLLTPRPILPGDFASLATRTQGVFRALAVDGLSPGRTITDGALTSGSPNLTSPAGSFTTTDVGRALSGTGIPGGTTVLTYTSPTAVVMSANASSTGSGRSVVLGDLSNVARTITIAGVDAAGAIPSSPVKAAMASDLEAQREVNFVVNVTDPTYTAIDITTSVVTQVGAAPDAVSAAVDAALTDLVSPATWGGGTLTPPQWTPAATTVRYLDVAATIRAIPGVDHIASLGICASGGTPGTTDVTLLGSAPLPQPGSLSVSAT
jgi:Baseplate J-like protein